MQQCVDHFSRACNNFGFTIRTKKTEVMHQPAPRKMYHEPHIFVNDDRATGSYRFFLLPGKHPLQRSQQWHGSQQQTFQNRLCIWKTQEESVGPTRNQPRDQANGIHGCGANCPAICMRVMDCVQPSRQKTRPLPYKMFADYFEHHVTINWWQDMIPGTEVPIRAGIPSIHTLLQKAQVRCAGHVTRMPDDGLPKQLL